jgi:hypothetical protein
MSSPLYVLSGNINSPQSGSDPRSLSSSSPVASGFPPRSNTNNFIGAYPAPTPTCGPHSQRPGVPVMYPNSSAVRPLVLLRLFISISTSIRLPTPLLLVKRPHTTSLRPVKRPHTTSLRLVKRPRTTPLQLVKRGTRTTHTTGLKKTTIWSQKSDT